MSMSKKDNFGFTAEDFTNFRQNIPKIHNSPFRDSGTSFFDAMLSSAADWTMSDESESILEVLKKQEEE